MSTGAAEYRHFLKCQRAAKRLAETIQAKAVRHGETELARLLTEWIGVQDLPGQNFAQLVANAKRSMDLQDKIRDHANTLRSREFANDERRLRHAFGVVLIAGADLADAWQQVKR